MESEVYTRVKISIKKLLEIDLDGYKDEQMKRRLDSWLIRCGSKTWEEYFARLRTDTVELGRFRDYLTINVSEFFRDLDRWQSLRDTVLPELIREARGRGAQEPLRIWSAGCSIGPEPYTLTITLDEMARGLSYYLLATDLDRGALKRAQARGPFTADDIRNVTAGQRSLYFEPGGPPYYIKETLANRIKFKEHNMISQPFEGNFDLIVCRNVIIYFTVEAKNILYQKFQAALRPGGILFLGGTEIIPRPLEYNFRSQGVSFYRKL